MKHKNSIENGSAAGPAAMTLATALTRAQPGIFGAPPSHALSLEFGVVAPEQRASSLGASEIARLTMADVHTIAQCLLGIAFAGDGARTVLGLGTALARRLGLVPAGLHDMPAIGSGRHGFVSTQNDLWILVPGDSAGAAFDSAHALIEQLAPVFTLREATALFRYREGRDLTGFRDGTENPKGEDVARAALLLDARYGGGSFALVQRFLHRHRRFSALSVDNQSLVIGRERDSDEEIDAAPNSAHVRRTAQEEFEPPAFMWRRSMPWGTPDHHGLQFIAFMAELDRADRMLRKMAGLEDGITDALLEFTQAQTGGYYFCPPLREGLLALALAG